MYLDPMEENETVQILKEDSLKFNISTQELVDNGRGGLFFTQKKTGNGLLLYWDLMDILIQRRFEQIEPELSNVLSYFKTPINSTKQVIVRKKFLNRSLQLKLLDYVQEVAPQYNNSVLWRMKIIEEKVNIYLGVEATEFVEWVGERNKCLLQNISMSGCKSFCLGEL